MSFIVEMKTNLNPHHFHSRYFPWGLPWFHPFDYILKLVLSHSQWYMPLIHLHNPSFYANLSKTLKWHFVADLLCKLASADTWTKTWFCQIEPKFSSDLFVAAGKEIHMHLDLFRLLSKIFAQLKWLHDN